MEILAYEHVGIRVSDRDEALEFYSRLGFTESVYFPDYPANEMVTNSGLRINLVFNGKRRANRDNVLFETDKTLPGITHPAFVIDDMASFLKLCGENDIAITEGPLEIDGRRRAAFIRDPDGNVLEFDEFIE